MLSLKWCESGDNTWDFFIQPTTRVFEWFRHLINKRVSANYWDSNFALNTNLVCLTRWRTPSRGYQQIGPVNQRVLLQLFKHWCLSLPFLLACVAANFLWPKMQQYVESYAVLLPYMSVDKVFEPSTCRLFATLAHSIMCVEDITMYFIIVLPLSHES